jgi:Mg-chelatase subunit ChlD
MVETGIIFLGPSTLETGTSTLNKGFKTRPIALKKDGVVEIVIILDCSSSMNTVVKDAIGSFNSFLDRQQAKDSSLTKFTLIQFNNRSKIISSGIDIRDALPLDRRTYVPRGSTALYDAIGMGINDVRRRATIHQNKVIFAILTDGKRTLRENTPRQKSRAK